MKAKNYTEEQIIAVLKEEETGAKVADLCRKYGMSDASYYNWKAKYVHIIQSAQIRGKRAQVLSGTAINLANTMLRC